MASAGYLISRAAEGPAILSLTGAIVAVRFFALARPLDALPRTTCLARPRLPRPRPAARPLLRAHRAARPGGARGVPAGRSSSAGWSATSTRSRACTCAASLLRSSPSRPARWRSASLPRSCRSPGRSSLAGLLVAGIGVPAIAGRLASDGRASASRYPGPPARGARRAPAWRSRARRVRARGGDAAAGARDRPGARPARAARRAGGWCRRRSGDARHRGDGRRASSPSRSRPTPRATSTACSWPCSACSHSPRSRPSPRCRRPHESCRRRSLPDAACSSSRTASPPCGTRLSLRPRLRQTTDAVARRSLAHATRRTSRLRSTA